MPRIEPIPLDQLADEPRRIIEEGVADGTYATPVPLQIFAYRSAQLAQVNLARTYMGAGSLLGGRILDDGRTYVGMTDGKITRVYSLSSPACDA